MSAESDRMICANGQVEIRTGDCRELLRAMPDQSVDAIVTSPPYFGLRDYGVDGQIGLEQTPQGFVAEMVAVFREARRVLRDDGTCWVNLGDSYCSRGGEHTGRDDNQLGVGAGARQWRDGSARADGSVREDGMSRRNRDGTSAPGIKPKDLIGIPWRVAFALQADGWYLRQDIIWAKPNPMPESVRDRCTKAHEYLFLLTKSARYWYDAEAVKEAVAPASIERLTQPTIGEQAGSDRVPGKTNGSMKAVGDITGRNKRSVWTVATQPYGEAHFATYPPALIEPCILAGCPKGGTVLDPFGGAGTTGLVAARHGRKAILCELNPAYAEMAHKRISREWREPVKEDAEPLGGLFA